MLGGGDVAELLGGVDIGVFDQVCAVLADG
ncbi:Uncharacterised protein [Mycobacteroides abscessus subsp. abscessus]|nr:Uncharacterised protein [Mycobacteroides abscessus subsp. abscessus]